MSARGTERHDLFLLLLLPGSRKVSFSGEAVPTKSVSAGQSEGFFEEGLTQLAVEDLRVGFESFQGLFLHF